MSNLPEQIAWESGIHQLEEADRAKAGPGGVLNIQANQLANRTRWLRVLVESASDYREYTFYKSESDPDGTISGLANTPAGKIFRVVQGLTDNFSIIYYLNDAGVAVPLTAFLGPGSVINNVREYPTLPVAQNDADAGNILDGSKCWVANVADETLADEFINNGGSLEATGRSMLSNTGVNAAIYGTEMEASTVSKGTLFADVGHQADFIPGAFYDMNGVLQSGATWSTYYVYVAPGQVIRASVVTGSYRGKEEIPLFSLLGKDKTFLSHLKIVVSEGTPRRDTFYVEAPQDGIIAIRVRVDSPSLGANSVFINSTEITSKSTLRAAITDALNSSSRYGTPEDYSTATRLFSGARFLYGGVLETGKGTGYGLRYIPVRAGEIVILRGAAGVASRGEVIPVLVQCDSNRNYVSTLLSQTSDGYITTGDFYTVATQTGYIAVCYRIVSGVTTVIKKYTRLLDYKTGITDAVMREVNHETEVTFGKRISSAGAVETASGWAMGILPTKSGDTVSINALHDSFSSTDKTVVIAQLDGAKTFVSALATFTNTGAGPKKDTFIADAIQDGYIAVSFRNSGNAPFLISSSRSGFSDPLDVYLEQHLDANGEADYTRVAKYEVNNTVIDSTFKLLTDTNYRTIWIPVRRGESVSAYTATGAAATGETPAADGSVPVMIQYDTRRANPVIRATASGTGSLTGYQTVSAKATADGYMAVRLYAADRGWPTVKRLAAKNGSDSGVASLPVVPGQFERLPVNADTNWDYNNSPYSQDNVVIAGDYQYAVVIGAGRVPYIAQRSKWGGAWLAVFDLGTIAGNPLASPTTADGHNVYNIGVSKIGHIIVAGNMHGDGPRAVVSDNPHNITAWTAVDFSAGMFTKDVTYPHFISYPDGTLQCYYRWGVRHYLTTYDESTKTFITPRHIVGAKADGRGGPYEQKYVVDNDGILHACWGYRIDATSALANEGLYYSQSPDKGATWRAADGSVISAAGTRNDANSTRIFSAETGSGYVNQNGGCVDIHGHYHTCLTQYDDNGNTQIVHVWWDGSAWKSEVVTDFDFRMNLSSNLVMNDITRPVIGATPSGRVYIIYHTTYNGLSGAIMAIDVTDEGNPQSMVVAGFDIGTQSMGFNVAHMLKTGDFMALMAKGVANSSSQGYGTFSAQPVMIATVPMP